MITIKQAALEVMKRHGQPMTSREVYNAVISARLYEFNSDAAPHIVQTQIRRYCEGLLLKNSSPNKYFSLVGTDQYVPLVGAIDIGYESSTIGNDLLDIIARNDLTTTGSKITLQRHHESTDRIKITSKERLIEARLGQGKFRSDLEAAWDRGCAVTGCQTGAALRASHIKSWAVSDDKERLDANNGLLLIATLDALFDHYRISFSEIGRMLISKYLPKNEYGMLGLYGSLRKPPNSQQSVYLAEHRLRFEKKEAELAELVDGEKNSK